VILDLLEIPAQPAILGLPETQAQLELKDLRVILVLQVRPGPQEILALLVLQVRLGLAVKQVQLDLLVSQAQLATLVLKETLDQPVQDPLARLDLQDQLDRQVLLEQQVLQDQLDRQGQRAQDLQGFKDQQDLKVLAQQGLLLLGQPDQLVP
jgi:hypothetical protein